MTSKCGKNKKVAHEAQPSVSLMFLPHFDIICDLLLNRRTATWNLFIKYIYIYNYIYHYIYIIINIYIYRKSVYLFFRFTVLAT